MHPMRNLQYSTHSTQDTAYGNSSRISSIMALPQQTQHYATTTNYLNYDSGAHELLAVTATITTTTTTQFTNIATTNSATNTTTHKNVLNCQQQQQQQRQYYQQQQQQQQQQRLSMPVIFGSTDSNTYWSNSSTYGQTKPVHARNKSASLLNQGNRKSAASTIKFLAESKPTYCNNVTKQQQQQQQQHNSSTLSAATLLNNSIQNGIGSTVVASNAAGVIDGSGGGGGGVGVGVGGIGTSKIMLPTLKCNRLPQAPTTINESVQTSVRRLSSDLTRKFDYRPIKVTTNSTFCAKEVNITSHHIASHHITSHRGFINLYVYVKYEISNESIGNTFLYAFYL